MKILSFFLAFLFSYSTTFATAYYTDSGASDPNDLNNWWTATNNTGSHPSNFTGAGDVFQVQSGHSYTTTGAWSITYNLEVSGTLNANHSITVGHDLKVYSGGSGLNIAGGVLVDVDEDVSGTGDITFAGAGSLFLGKHFDNTGALTTVAGSTVKYKTTDSFSRKVKYASYYHLIIDKGASVKTYLDGAGTINVNGDLTITSGELSADSLSVINVTGSTTIDTDGMLWFDYLHGITNRADVNLQALYLTGGKLGEAISGYDWGYVDCSTLTITGTTNQINRVILTVSGTTQVTGTVSLYDDGNSISQKHFVGVVTVDGAWISSDATSVTMDDNLIVNGSFSDLLGTYTFTGASKSIGGTATKVTLYNAFFNGTCTNNVDTLTLKNDLEGSGTLTNAANGVLEIGDNAHSIGALIATAVPNEVIYNGDGTYGDQTGIMTDYYNLTINNTGGNTVNFSSSSQFGSYSSGVDVNVANHCNIKSNLYWKNYYDKLIGNDLTVVSGATFSMRGRKGTVGALPGFTGSYNLDVNSTVLFKDNGTMHINTTGITYGNMVCSSSSRKTLAGNLDLDGDLTIEGAGYLDATTSNYAINLAGDWISTTTHASYSLRAFSNKVILDGSGPQSITCSGRSQEELYNLTIANSGNTVTMNDNVRISNQLDFTTSGYLDINSNTLTIENWDDGNIVTLGTDRYVIGDNSSAFTINGVDAGETAIFPIGFSTSSTDFCRADILNNDGANTSFSLSPCQYLNEEGTCSGGTPITSGYVDITWNITSASTNAEVSLYWDISKELSGFDRTSCDGAHFSASWATLGSLSSSTNLSGSIYYGTATTTSFSPFTVTTSGALPIELTYFDATILDDVVELNWQTNTEINNDYFSIERSKDAQKWEEVLIIDGAGNSSMPITYKTYHKKPYSGLSYYRLKQTDFNGSFTYSKIRTINFEGVIAEIAIYPNPSSSTITIEGSNGELKRTRIYNVLGQDVNTFVKIIEIDETKIILDLSNLKTGIYYIKTETTTNKVYKQ